jgi:hypothetical protein
MFLRFWLHFTPVIEFAVRRNEDKKIPGANPTIFFRQKMAKLHQKKFIKTLTHDNRT